MASPKTDVRVLNDDEISTVSGADSALVLGTVFVFGSMQSGPNSPLAHGFGLGITSGRLSHVRITDGYQ